MDRFSPEHDINAHKADVGTFADFSVRTLDEEEDCCGPLTPGGAGDMDDMGEAEMPARRPIWAPEG